MCMFENECTDDSNGKRNICKFMNTGDKPPKCFKGDLQQYQKDEVSPSNSSALLCAKRLDYIKRLVDGVEGEIAKEMVEIDGDMCTPSKWIDASLLCQVIKQEILST